MSATRQRVPEAEEFPMLSQFVAGYLHEDFVQVHSTPAGAMRAFLADASAAERDQLRQEATRFLSAASTRPWPEVASAFHRLGGAWSPRTRAELASLLRIALFSSH
jgi:hypothetical protein